MNARVPRTILAGLVVFSAALPAAAQFAGTEVSAPGSPTPFLVTKALWSWEDMGPGISYSIYRSPTPDGGFECILDLHPSNTWTGDASLPGAGNVFHYLVTGFDGTEDNSPGTWSDGTPRVLSVPCPRLMACCALDGSCTDLDFDDCNAQGGDPRGIGTSCVTVTCPAPEACCHPDGSCDDLLPVLCVLPATPEGPGTSCLTFICPALEACCMADGSCVDLLPADCATQAGAPQGPGTDCLTSTCIGDEACCMPDGSCVDLQPGECITQGGAPQGVGTTCLTSNCVANEACCFGDGSCSELTPADCVTQGGAAQGVGTTCLTTTCVANEACCFADGSCADRTPADCATQGGAPQGVGTTCLTSTCVANEACCFANGSCTDRTPADCAAQSGTPQGPGTSCLFSTCIPSQACCMPDGSCDDLTPAACVLQGGSPQGPATNCLTSTCVADEACCLPDGSCADLAPADCATQGGIAQGLGTDCSSATCSAFEACCTAAGLCTDAQPADCLAVGSTPLGPCTQCATSMCPLPCTSGLPVPGRPALRRQLIGNFDRPIFLTAPPGDFERIFILERPGRIRVRHRDGTTSLFLDFAARVPSLNSEKGALGLAFHPDYACNGKFYVHYSGAATAGCGPDNCATLAEFTVSAADPDVADPASFRVVLQQADFAANHNGGWIAFGPDGYLYQACGDGGGGGDPNEYGQNRGIWLGKILRIDVDARDAGQYGVPPSNPFVGVAGTLPEIWSLGVRNPWRNSFDRATGDLYIADVGQGSWEEIDVAPASAGGGSGVNYGWDDMEGLVCFEPAAGCLTAGRTLPDRVYPHSDGCSITGGYVYRGCRMPGWNGVYFFADYCNEWMDAFEYVGGAVTNYQRVFPAGTLNGPVSFGEDAAGEIYIIEQGGAVVRLEP